MFNNRLRNSLIGGMTVGVLAILGFAPEAKSQELIRSNIAPRPVRSNLVVPQQIRSNVLAPSVRSNLTVIANDLNTTVDDLLSNLTIAQIAISPSGAQVLSSLQAAGGITETSGGQFDVEETVDLVE